jgi:hypothetical protein
MNVGSRVQTPAGPGQVTSLDDVVTWVFGRPERKAWILVRMDADNRIRMFPPVDVEELDPETEWPE